MLLLNSGIWDTENTYFSLSLNYKGAADDAWKLSKSDLKELFKSDQIQSRVK